MKIAYFVHCYPPAKGGLEYLSGEIVSILRAAGHEVHVFTGKGATLDSYKTFSDWVDESGDDHYIHRLPLRFFWQRVANKLLNKLIFLSGFFSPWYFGPILEYSKQDEDIIADCDLIFGAGMPTKMFYDSYRFAKKYKKRLIVHPSYHDVSYYNRSVFFQRVLGFAKMIIFQTPQEKEKLQNRYKILETKLYQLTFSPYAQDDIERQQLNSEDKLLRLLSKVKNSKPITIGYVGQITLRKNLTYFLNFLDGVQRKDISFQFLLAGVKTNTSHRVEEQLKALGDKLEIIYNFDKKDEVFEKIDIFVNPSFEESLGLVNFEAMYYGCPVFVHEDSAFYSLLSESKLRHAQYFSNYRLKNINYEQIEKMLYDGELLKKILHQQYTVLEEYSKTHYSQQLLSFLSEV